MLKKLYMFGVFLMLSVSVSGCGKKQPVVIEHTLSGPEETVRPEESAIENAVSEEAPEAKETDEKKEPAASVFVYVCGAVAESGVYELKPGSRIYQAIELAGGFTEEAAAECVNLADVVSDAQMIRIYTREEYDQMGASGTMSGQPESAQPADGESQDADSDGKININTATKEQLMTLPGIGETKAENILAYRESQGDFRSIEELMNVNGIKDGIYARVKDVITVQ